MAKTEKTDPSEALNDLWEALYAVRCIAEHSGGKNASARQMRSDIAAMREISDSVLQQYPELSPT